MNEEIYEAMEEALLAQDAGVDTDEMLIELTELFFDGQKYDREVIEELKIGSCLVKMQGKLVAGEEAEEDCVFVDWIEIGSQHFDISDYLA